MNYEKLILNKLLDKYEKSKSYREETNRKILLKISEIEEYDIENYEKKQLFHDILEYLKKLKLIDFSWKKYEDGNIVEKIWLEKDNVELAYKKAERHNIKDEALEIKEELIKVKFESSWMKSFKEDLIENIENKEKENNLLPYLYYKEIIKALQCIDIKENWIERTFSIKCFGDSKYFERNIKKYIVKIIRKYLLMDADIEYTDEEVLLEVGISKYPEIIEFNGNIDIQLQNVLFNYNIISNGAYINSDSIKKITSIDMKNIERVIFIENKANYIDYIYREQKEDELVIFHGGMYSPNKRIFFEKIYRYASNETVWYHWSDIDLGGFNIFIRLKNNIIYELQQYKMSKKDFYEQKKYWKTFDDKYRKKLEKKLHDNNFIVFHDVIEAMLKENSKLEQEAFLIL